MYENFVENPPLKLGLEQPTFRRILDYSREMIPVSHRIIVVRMISLKLANA